MDYDCSSSNLTTLVGGPTSVDGYYHCYDNQLTDLVGCASHIGGQLYISNNQITSLVGIHKIIKSCNIIYIGQNNDVITEGGIGLLLINNLINIYPFEYMPFQIIQKYLGTGTKGMMACRKELISNGYSEYAKL